MDHTFSTSSSMVTLLTLSKYRKDLTVSYCNAYTALGCVASATAPKKYFFNKKNIYDLSLVLLTSLSCPCAKIVFYLVLKHPRNNLLMMYISC